ncbi:MAG: T9SS type A sorting domain-containing protein [Melioribacteraceae bacterium]|nr:T9SS type A sorting domain-containing protein [Melioribacteraceae bacterium]
MKNLFLLLFVFLTSSAILFAQDTYFTETFDDTSSVIPKSSPGPTTPTKYKLERSGEWTFLGVYLGGSTNGCGTITTTSRTLRMPKISTVQGAGITPPCYAISPKLSGVGKVSFKEGRGGASRIISVYKSTDDGATWTLVGKTDQGTTKCVEISYTVNDSKANRIKFANESDAGDVDLEDVVITKSTGVSVENIETIPTQYILEQNYPNPFNPETNIKFSIPKDGLTKLAVYDLLGNEIATIVNKYLSAGNYSFSFNAKDFPSGIYLYQLNINGLMFTKKMMLVK